jgi:Domain of unknown function (DUF4184)
VPYAFAHPAAVVPVAKLLGKRAVPSALAIGSMIPDAWYFVPSLARADSHDGLGWLWFCLPAALFAYAAFHLIFKQPLLALIPGKLAQRLSPWTCDGLPRVPWFWVLLSLLAGILTHLAWDEMTHEGLISDAFPVLEAKVFAVGALELRPLQILQHVSTLVGTIFLAAWLWQKLRDARAQTTVLALHRPFRLAIVVTMVLIPAAAFAIVASALFGMSDWRSVIRAAGVTAFSTLGLVALSFCLAWHILDRIRR